MGAPVYVDKLAARTVYAAFGLVRLLGWRARAMAMVFWRTGAHTHEYGSRLATCVLQLHTHTRMFSMLNKHGTAAGDGVHRPGFVLAQATSTYTPTRRAEARPSGGLCC